MGITDTREVGRKQTGRGKPTMPIGLVALAMGGFGIGLTEFVISGLLPELAAEFAVSIPRAGQLVSVYALAVAIGGITLTAATSTLRPKPVLVALMGLFIAGNLINALASTFTVMMVGRVVAALCHGAFFGIGAVVAASLVPPDRTARAIATMFLGLTVANVVGVPLGTFLGQAFGWRTTFWVITGIGVVAVAGLVAFIPAADRSSRPKGQLRRELGAFRSGQVWVSIAITVFGFGAMFGAFTYVAPLVTEVAGLSTGAIPWMLIVFGVGLFVGNLVGGRAADRSLDRSLVGLLAALVMTLGALWAAASNPWAVGALLFLLGASGFACVPGMQMRVLNYAKGAPVMASGVNIAGFNLGNALGVQLGGMAIGAGFGYRSPLWVGAGLAAVALALVTGAVVRTSRRRSAEPA
jgi:DHA1 family inner membrane transport protein